MTHPLWIDLGLPNEPKNAVGWMLAAIWLYRRYGHTDRTWRLALYEAIQS